MRLLMLSSYICAVLTILAMAILMMQPRVVEHLDYFLILAFFPPALQILYTYMTSSMLMLDEFKPTELLDDLELNHLQGDDEVVGTGFWLKGIATINSFVLCFVVLTVVSSMQVLFLIILDDGSAIGVRYATVSVFGAAVFAIPAVVYNLRTFNLKRIRRSGIA